MRFWFAIKFLSVIDHMLCKKKKRGGKGYSLLFLKFTLLHTKLKVFF